ncbi:MAG: right-handed parallel beta-helix repeat-containing protein [Phycisphaerae bacterium]|jgi:hypothetical protein|nr:right-handed parallel beta-helix repeat-containing protein [Phycisphaerae bacterium]
MNSKFAAVILSIAATVLSGCGPRVIRVGTVEELISAIGPDRYIAILPGRYDLSSVAQRQMKYVLWSKVHDGYELIIRNVRGLKLIGLDEPVKILAKPRYANVLSFTNCRNIHLQNLVLGHTPEGYCTGGVVRMTKCSGVRIYSCNLFGCGIEGLELREVKGLEFYNSVIRDCTYGIMTVVSSSNIIFNDSIFMQNREFGGFTFTDSRNVRLERCVIEGNRFDSLDAILFSATSCSDIELRGCTITGNVFKTFMKPANSIKVTGTRIEGNSEPPPTDPDAR